MVTWSRAALILLSAAGFCAAQIPMRSLRPEGAPKKQASAFDSTKNFQGENLDAYIGQALYLKGMSSRMRQFGYERFFSRIPQGPGDTRAIYKRGAPLNRFNSRYDALAFRCFTAVEILRSSLGVEPTYARDRIFLKLVDRGNSEVLYYEYEPRLEHLFPFIVQGFFEKLRRKHQGQRFLVRRTAGICGPEFVNTEVHPGDTVTCGGMFVEDRTFSLLASLKRGDGQELLAPPERLTNDYYLMDVAAAEKFRQELGDEAWGSVLRGIVRPGMTPRMCEVAWGTPVTVNRIVHQHGAMEQWVYSLERSIYLENGAVTSVQDEPAPK